MGGGGRRREWLVALLLDGFGDLQIIHAGEQQKPITPLWQKYEGLRMCYETVHVGRPTQRALNEGFESQLSGHFLLHLTRSIETLYPKKREQRR